MRKIFYTALIVLATMMSITSCTEETVTPVTNTADNGGGNGQDDPLR